MRAGHTASRPAQVPPRDRTLGTRQGVSASVTIGRGGRGLVSDRRLPFRYGTVNGRQTRPQIADVRTRQAASADCPIERALGNPRPLIGRPPALVEDTWPSATTSRLCLAVRAPGAGRPNWSTSGRLSWTMAPVYLTPTSAAPDATGRFARRPAGWCERPSSPASCSRLHQRIRDFD
jgi:hypothetical protein